MPSTSPRWAGVRRQGAAPADHPLIVHLAAADALDDWARAVSDAARELARTYWPGPLTLVLPRRPHVRDELGDAADLVVDGVPCAVGVESTIVSLLGAD